MKHRLFSLWPYLLALVLLYYVFPLFMGTLGPFLPLLVFMPAGCFACGSVCALLCLAGVLLGGHHRGS